MTIRGCKLCLSTTCLTVKQSVVHVFRQLTQWLYNFSAHSQLNLMLGRELQLSCQLELCWVTLNAASKAILNKSANLIKWKVPIYWKTANCSVYVHTKLWGFLLADFVEKGATETALRMYPNSGILKVVLVLTPGHVLGILYDNLLYYLYCYVKSNNLQPIQGYSVNRCYNIVGLRL